MASSCLANLIILLAILSACVSATTEENAYILSQIKSSFVDPIGSLKSWTQEKNSTLCKDWYGITCDYTNSMIVAINLPNKNISGSLSPAIGSLRSLQTLNISGNMVTGAVPVEITDCASLRVLDLSNNNFTGELPMGLWQLTHLETLSLWTNSFIGPIPKDIVLCANLKYLDLGGSYLEGEIPHAIGNLTSLEYLTLAGNELTGEIPASLKQLRKLQWIYIGYNQLTGSIPSELGEIISLKHLDLVHNNLTGELPLSLTNLTNLEYLFLYDNQLNGLIPPGIANLSKLLSLDLSSNLLSGNIPSGFSNLQHLQILNLFSNALTREIPHAIADMQSLQVLALWMNNLTGKVPANLGLQNNLTVVDLSSNQLRGPIPEHLCASKRLRNLILFTNSMLGPIPQSLASCHSLERVRLERNHFTGSFPQALASLPLVYYLDLSSNNFSGRLDGFTWNMPSLQVLQLQGNHFNGSITASIENSKGLVTLDLSKNSFTGGIPLELGSLTKLNKLYLNDNMLSGTIQSAGFLLCKQLNDINLSNNQLNGIIPSHFARLSLLTTLDLSHNQFSGTIPPQLGDMDSLVYVNLSFNHLYGQVPLSGAFIDINASSLEGNLGLCGRSLKPCSTAQSEHRFGSGSVKARLTAVLFLIGLMIAVVGIGNVIWKIKHGEWGDKSILKLKSMKSKAGGDWNLRLFQTVQPTVEEVLEAMQEENVVEKKSPCIIYKGRTKAGVQFAAMEMINADDKNSEKAEFGDVLAAIGRSRHPNIVSVYGICRGTTSSIMLFELVQGYTRLSSLLEHDHHGDGAFNWDGRLHVAVGIAKAILHLQSSCSPPILHGSICPNNVLIDTMFAVRLLPPITSRACLLSTGNTTNDAEANWFASDICAFGEVLLHLMMGISNCSNRELSHTELWQPCESAYGMADSQQTARGVNSMPMRGAAAVGNNHVAGEVITSPIARVVEERQQVHAAGGEMRLAAASGAEVGRRAVGGASRIMVMTDRRGKAAAAAAGVELAVELCRNPTQGKLRQVVRVLEGWRRCEGGGSCSLFKAECRGTD